MWHFKVEEEGRKERKIEGGKEGRKKPTWKEGRKKAWLLCAVCFTAAPSIPNEGLQRNTLTFRRKCASSLLSTRGLVKKTDSLLVPPSIH